MEIYCYGTARVRHAVTGEVYSIAADELDCQDAGGDERPMGPAFHYEALVEHPELGLMSWGVWEYPEGAENMTESKVGQHILVEDFDFGLQHEEPEPDNWLEYEPPNSPYLSFLTASAETIELLNDRGTLYGTSNINRMLFTQQIVALEAYLCDTLVAEVGRDKKAQDRLISQAQGLSDAKFTLEAIRSTPDFAKTKVREYLRDILYHNLEKVDVLYRIALGIRILPLATDKGSLMRAILRRHDCVHRNGYDKQGNKLDDFTQAYVLATALLVRQFVEAIEAAVTARAPTQSDTCRSV